MKKENVYIYIYIWMTFLKNIYKSRIKYGLITKYRKQKIKKIKK